MALKNPETAGRLANCACTLHGAATALRAAGGFNPFLRTQRALTGEQVRAFLLLDPTFPRSTLQAAIRAERAVRQMGTYVSPQQTSTLLRTVGTVDPTWPDVWVR